MTPNRPTVFNQLKTEILWCNNFLVYMENKIRFYYKYHAVCNRSVPTM